MLLKVVFVWGYCSNLVGDFAQCNLGFRFGDVNLKVDMLMDWDALVYYFVQMWCSYEVVTHIYLKISPSAMYT